MTEPTRGPNPVFDVPADVFDDHVVLRPPNRLKERATIPTTKFDKAEPDVVLRAEHALKLLSNEFDDWMAVEVEALEKARQSAALSREITTVSGVYTVAHDIRGQAATFGYPLVGEIAEGLCELFERLGDRLPPQKLIDLHVESIRAMVREQVRERDHPVGAAIVRRMRELRDEVAPRIDAD